MGTGPDYDWQCTACGRDKESKTDECSHCGSYESVSVQPSAIVHTKVNGESDSELTGITHVNIDNIAAIVTDSPSIRPDVFAVVSTIIVLQAVVGMTTFDTRYAVSMFPLFGLFGVLVHLRQPDAGVTIQSLSGSHNFAGDPAPFVNTFEASSDTVLSYASGWRTWLYVVNREYWIEPEHIDSLTHEIDTARNAILWALLAGSVAGSGTVVATIWLGIPLDWRVAGLATFALVGVGVWWSLHETATMDVIELWTTTDRSFRFPLAPEVATRFRDRYAEALDDREDAWIDIHHEPDQTERVPIPNVQAVTRTEHDWTTLAYVIAVLGHVLLGISLWQATGVIDLSTISRAIATVGLVGLVAVIVYVLARRPDQVFVTTGGRTRAVPADKAEDIAADILDGLDSVVELEHTVESFLSREQQRVSIDPSAVALLDQVETDATWLRRPRLVVVVLLASLGGVIGSYQFGRGALWLFVAALAVCVSAGVVAWAWTGTHYAKVRLTLTSGEQRTFFLAPAEASNVVDSVFASHAYASRTVETTVSRLLKPLNWHRTLTRYANLSNVGVLTRFFPTLTWGRRAVLGVSIVATLGLTYVVYTTIVANYLLAGGMLVVGGGMTFLIYGLLLDDPGLKVVTGAGELRVYEADNDGIIGEFADEQSETLELSTGSYETDETGTWHVAPNEIVALEQRKPPWYPSAVLVLFSLIGSAGAAYAVFQDVSTDLAGYAIVLVVFVASVFLLGTLLGWALEWLGLPIFDRLVADLAGKERVREVLDDEPDFSPFDDRSPIQQSEASIYRVGTSASERGTPAERLWGRIRSLVGRTDDAAPGSNPADRHNPSDDEE